MQTVGIDEVGRGCWAGPLVAGAVLLPSKTVWEVCPPKIGDSKKLSKKQRDIAATWIHRNATAVGLGWVWPEEIDRIGITASVKKAMALALEQISVDYDQVIIDGSINYLAENTKTAAVIKADDSVLAVSAASIIAKVARDTYMAELGEAYAGYGFDSHVGYGTAAHIAALQLLGVSDIHRMSYKPIQKLLS